MGQKNNLNGLILQDIEAANRGHIGVSMIVCGDSCSAVLLFTKVDKWYGKMKAIR